MFKKLFSKLLNAEISIIQKIKLLKSKNINKCPTVSNGNIFKAQKINILNTYKISVYLRSLLKKIKTQCYRASKIFKIVLRLISKRFETENF